MEIVETAYAKINLALHVRRRRSDGYHDLETVFAFCKEGDTVSVAPSGQLTLAIDGSFAGGLPVAGNLVLQAARALDPSRGAAIRLTKNLPIASGIGGGSADAAAALRALTRLWNVPLPGDDAIRALGADVPACVGSRTCRAEGIGDVMTAGEVLGGTPVLLVNPRVPVSTAAVFRAWDGVDRGPLGDWRGGRNDLEASALALAPAIAVVLETLAACAGNARMSGSGATCFAVFENTASRDAAAAEIGSHHPDWWAMGSVLR